MSGNRAPPAFTLLLLLGSASCDALGGRPSDGVLPEDPDEDAGPAAGDPGDAPDDPTGEAPSDAAAIDAYVFELGTPDIAPKEVIDGPEAPEEATGDYVCQRQEFEETEHFHEIVSFAAHSQAMYPGAIIGGESIHNGALTPKVLDRAPLRISASLEGVLDGPVSATLEKPSLSTFRDAMATILQANVIGQTPANIAFDMKEVYSQEQLDLALGVDVSWITAQLGASFGFSEEETRSRIAVNFTQVYYTVDVDPPGVPSDMFAPTVSIEQVRDELADEPPAYVSSVSYGRVVYFAVTSEFSSEELRAALDFGFTTGAVDVEGNVSLTHAEVLAESEITAFIMGGSGDIAVKALHGVAEVREFISTGGSYSPNSPGAPIAYQLSYLSDNSPARFALTSEYELETCERARQNVRLAFDSFRILDVEDTYGNLELYGSVIVTDEYGNDYVVYEATRDQVVTLDKGETWPQQGNLGVDTIPVVPQPGHGFTVTLDFWDKDALGFDDAFGQRVLQIDFEDGWRSDDHVVSFSNGSDQFEVHLDYQPVP